MRWCLQKPHKIVLKKRNETALAIINDGKFSLEKAMQMAITLNNLDKWKRVESGEIIVFAGEKLRRIRLQLNTSARTNVHVLGADAVPQFIGTVDGFDVIDFQYQGDLELLMASEGEVWLYSGEMEFTAKVIEDAESFTKVYERKARNPDLEYMLHRMQATQEQRIAQLADVYERRFESLVSSYEQNTTRVPDREAVQGLPEQDASTGDGQGSDVEETEGDATATSGGN